MRARMGRLVLTCAAALAVGCGMLAASVPPAPELEASRPRQAAAACRALERSEVAAAAGESAPRVLERVAPQAPRTLWPGSSVVSVARARVRADGTLGDIVAIHSEGTGVDLNDWNLKVAESLQRWRFAPATHGGAPVEAEFTTRIQARGTGR